MILFFFVIFISDRHFLLFITISDVRNSCYLCVNCLLRFTIPDCLCVCVYAWYRGMVILVCTDEAFC